MALAQYPKRIACLQPSATVTLQTLGELDRVVACTRYCLDVVPEIAAREPLILADSWTANAAEILQAKADLVIASVPYQEKAVGEILKAGVRFLGLAPRTLADIYSDIATIAGAIGANQRGEDAIAAMQARVEGIRQRVKGESRPKVFCEEWGKPIIASQAWVAELVEAGGGSFVGECGRSISEEEILGLNPEVIVAAWCGAGDRVPLEKIIAARGWQNTSAARSGRVYCIRDEFLNTPAPSLLDGLDALAWAIHPEVFPRTKGIRRITTVPGRDVASNVSTGED
ncbi:MAG: ABC transporter substrate-binding protein [Candidatus Sulfotelmatobacter sp.]